MRITLLGNNFASRLIKVNNQLFKSQLFKTHTTISLGNEQEVEILRTRVLNKGKKMLITARIKEKSPKEQNDQLSITISTPKGQAFKEDVKIEK